MHTERSHVSLQVRNANEENEVEQAFTSDVIRCIKTKWHARKKHWPIQELIFDALERYPDKKPVDLQEILDSQIFESAHGCTDFINYFYFNYDFLYAKVPNRYPSVCLRFARCVQLLHSNPTSHRPVLLELPFPDRNRAQLSPRWKQYVYSVVTGLRAKVVEWCLLGAAGGALPGV